MYLGSSFLQAQNTGRRKFKPPVMFISQVHFLWSIIIASRLSLSHLTVLISLQFFGSPCQSGLKWLPDPARMRTQKAIQIHANRFYSARSILLPKYVQCLFKSVFLRMILCIELDMTSSKADLMSHVSLWKYVK